jgi:hypothetical protein
MTLGGKLTNLYSFCLHPYRGNWPPIETDQDGFEFSAVNV